MVRLGLILRLFRSAAKIQRKRMLLTVASITWGTISIVLLLAFGEGLKRSLATGVQGMGKGIGVIWPRETSMPWAGLPAGREIRLLPADADLLQASAEEIAVAAGEMDRWGSLVTYGETSLNKKITGVHPRFGPIRNLHPQEGGRFLDPLDQKLKRRVIFLGDQLKEDLFGAEPAVGKFMAVENVPFLVVGVLKEKVLISNYGGMDEDQGFIPLATFETMFGRRHLDVLVIKPTAPALMDRAERRMNEVLGAKYRFNPDDEHVLQMWNTVETQRDIVTMSVGIEVFLGIIGALTLLIGGVGVANIMYAVVKQRTQEIGIQMAIGARRAWVMGPLVLESLALTFLGGGIGIAVGATLAQLAAMVFANADNEAMRAMGEPTFSIPLALITITILGSIGFLAGYFPARRATSIQPAAVLRCE